MCHILELLATKMIWGYEGSLWVSCVFKRKYMRYSKRDFKRLAAVFAAGQ